MTRLFKIERIHRKLISKPTLLKVLTHLDRGVLETPALLLDRARLRERALAIGRFLQDLKQKFEGPVVVDMLCYLRLYTELALRAKGMLMMRENGLDTPVGERTRAKFEEMRYLEKSIGKTGCLAMSPFLQMTRKDLWQLYVLE